MVFTNAFISKLSSLLRPWLADKDREPQLDLRLGFLRSELKTKKLEFDVLKLNSGLDDESVFVFEKVEAKDVDLRVSPWFKPSVDVRVGSLDVRVSPRELGSGNRRDDCKNLDEKEKKEIIALIDSEGAILHEMIETLSVKFSQNRLLTNLKLSILKSFNIKFDEINLSLHCSDKTYFLTLKAKDLLFEPDPNSLSSFFNGILSASFSPRKKNNYLNITCTTLDFEINENGNIHQAVSFMDLSFFIKFQNLKPSDFAIQISNINCSVSLQTISYILIILDKFIYRAENESINTRNGQELWYIASKKIIPKSSLKNVGFLVINWQKYVSAYMLLLSVIGFPNEKLLKKNCTKLQLNGNCRVKKSLNRQLAIVNKLEEKLPKEAIAKGRKIARLKMLENCRNNNNNNDKFWGNFVKYPFLKILWLVSLLLGFVLFILRFLMRVFGVKSENNSSSFMDIFNIVCNDFDAQMQYSFYLGEFKFILSPIENLNPKMPTICLALNSATFINSIGYLNKFSFVSLGEIKLRLERENLVLYSEPASLARLSERKIKNVEFLRDNLEELWSNWTQISEMYNDLNVGSSTERPFLLFEFKSSNFEFGLEKCGLILGKLNLNLEYQLILLIYQFYLMSNNNLNGEEIQSLSNPSISDEETQVFKLYTNQFKKLGLGFTPQKEIEIATLILGPQIRVKLEDCSIQELIVDLDTVEFYMLPKMETIENHQNPFLASNMKYTCKRLNAHEGYLNFANFGIFVEDLKENSTSRIFGPISVKFEFSTFRESFESLCGSDIFLSSNLNGGIFGISADLYMDEILSLFQGFKSMQYTISSSSPNLFSAASLYSPNFMKKSTNSSIKTTNWNNNLQLMADFILDIEPVEIMLKHSRDSDPNSGFQKPGIEKPGIGFSVSKSQIKFSLSEKQTEFLIELVQLKSLISDSSDLSRVEKMDCFSLSKLKFGFLFDDSCKLDVGIEIFRVFLGDYELNESLMSEIYEPVVISLIISDNLQSVVCKIQGGFIFMETSTLAKFANCINAYYYFERFRVSEPSSSARTRVSEASSSQTERIRVSENSSSQRESSFGFFLIKDFNMDLSQFSLTLALANQSGEIQELNISTTTNLQILNFSKTISFNLSSLSISKNNWTKSKLSLSSQNSNSSLSPHFRSEFSPNLPILRVEEFEGSDLNFPTNEGCICKDIKIVGKIEKNNLERGIGSVKLMSDWIGKVVLSGLDFNLSLSTIQMLSDLFAPLNGIKSGTKGQKSTQIIQSDDQNCPNNSDCKIPEGAIVTLMDLDQHMYISIEDTETKYRVVGSPHYFLAGKRALFRVRHHKKWRSEEQIVSFTSIYSQNNNYNQNNNHNNNNSKPICLGYNSKSDFVSTSSNPDKPFSHWKLIPAPNPNYSEDYDKSFNSVPENHPNTFYLVNYKNTLGIKFIDGFPEFVKKPGNPFKIRVFDESTINGFCMDWNLLEGSGLANENAPAVQIRVENISVMVSHEVSDVKYEVPLLRGCVNDVNVNVHCCDDKIRVLAFFDVLGRYFDARRDEWKDIIPPVSSFCFFRYRFLCQKPIRCFFSMKQMNIYINELSIDVLLYLVGKLDLMGPYAVKNSTIFPNSCKIENQSGLSLLCHFPNQQDVMVPPKQSSSLLLRHVAVGNEETQKHENFVSICLVKQNAFSTSQINISLVDSHVFAWRTRITSLNDSRSFPGPFIVVEVSKQFEEGLCISVSPLLKLHNKTELPVELRFTRPGESIDESAAFVTLRNGEVIDESMGLFDAIELTGGSKRALLSLALGNFLLSFRPVIPDQLKPPNSEPVSADWSENITGEKPTRISGVFDKLNFKLKRAFGAYSFKSLFSSLSCPFSANNHQVSDLHFLIHTVLRDVPLQKPSSRERNSPTSPSSSSSSSSSSSRERNSSPVALQMQREIFIYPTVQVSNFLQMDVRVVLSENETEITSPNSTFGRDSIIPCNSSSYFYVDPSSICVSVTLIPTNSKCKTLNSTECVRKLRKTENQFLDLELEFESGKYFAGLRLLRGDKGILEVAIFTKYTLHNNTELPLLCTTSYLKSLSRLESGHESSNISPEHGCYLSPDSSASWFAKSTEVHIKSTSPATSVSHLNMDALSAFTEIRLETQNPNFDSNCQLAVLGVSLNPLLDKVDKVSLVPAQLVRIVPRYVVSNDSSHDLMVRQCYVEDNSDGTLIKPNGQITLLTTKPKTRSKETFFDSLLKPHKFGSDESRIFLQFRPLNGSVDNEGFGWSGPVCAASLGRFYVKFRKNEGNDLRNKFGIVRVLEENNSLVLRFDSDCGNELPYRIENHLSGVSVMYSQKGSIEADVLGSGESADYIWDDINLPHKLVVRIVDMNLLREISIDKICAWRPFFKMRQNKTLGLDLSLLEKGLFFSEKGQNSDESVKQRPVLEIGYEVYFDGQTRVLRLCQRGGGSAKSENLRDRFANLRFRVVSFCLHFRESNNQIVDELPIESTIVIINFAYVSLDSVITNQQKHISARIQAINADERWSGAKFGSILRRSQTNDFGSNENILSVILVLSSKKSSIKLVDYFSSVLQPIDLKIDEDTLMKLVPFWRSSLSDPNTPSQKYYFKHFEIHPIKIIASFQPGISNTTYTSTQEALRSLLHTVVKVPAISNSVVELNGVLLNHALVTSRELALKCAQHYSWYILRAVYVAKGSKLLPPTFASIFDDSALSSLDVFFDPSDGSISLPGVTIGMFKFISKGIKSKGVFGTKRYFGDLGKTIKRAGSKALFAVVTEISDNVLRGAETNGFNGMMNGFHQGIMRLAMEPSVLGLAIMDGGPDRKIKLDRNPGLDELYIEGYLQGMLDVTYKLEYLRVRVIDDQVILKNLPPSSTVMKEIMENVKSFLISKSLLKGDSSSSSRPLRHLHSEREWRLGPTLLTLCEHLFVGFAIRFLQNQSSKISTNLKQKAKTPKTPQEDQELEESKKGINPRFNTRVWAVGRFVLSGLIAYVDGRLCRNIPNPIVRRIVSGFLLSFLDRKDATQS